MPDPAPWTRQQLATVAVLATGGLVAVVVAWWGSGGEDTLDGQTTWLNVATAGLVVTLCGLGSLLLAGRRAVGARRRRLLDGHPLLAEAPTTVDAAGGWVWVRGTVRAHHPGCALAAGKRAEAVEAKDIRRHGLRRCEVCAG